jgi:hypothetical protein
MNTNEESITDEGGTVGPLAGGANIAVPVSGGSYVRDPQTGELQRLVAPPKPAPKKQSTEE